MLIKLLVWFWQSLHFSTTRLCYNLCALPRANILQSFILLWILQHSLSFQQVPLGSHCVLFFATSLKATIAFMYSQLHDSHMQKRVIFIILFQVPVFLFFLASFLNNSGVLEGVILVFCLGLTTSCWFFHQLWISIWIITHCEKKLLWENADKCAI